MVVAGAMAPFGRGNTEEDTCPVGRDGSDVRKACNVAPVSLTADGIESLNTPMRMLFWAAGGLMRYNVWLSGGHLPRQAVLSLLT